MSTPLTSDVSISTHEVPSVVCHFSPDSEVQWSRTPDGRGTTLPLCLHCPQLLFGRECSLKESHLSSYPSLGFFPTERVIPFTSVNYSTVLIYWCETFCTGSLSPCARLRIECLLLTLRIKHRHTTVVVYLCLGTGETGWVSRPIG